MFFIYKFLIQNNFPTTIKGHSLSLSYHILSLPYSYRYFKLSSSGFRRYRLKYTRNKIPIFIILVPVPCYRYYMCYITRMQHEAKLCLA